MITNSRQKCFALNSLSLYNKVEDNKTFEAMIKYVIFDFAGVITDLTWEGAVVSFTKIGLKNADKILDRYQQNGIFQALEEGRMDMETFRKEFSAMCGRDLTHDEIREAWMGYFNGMDERKLDFIEELRKDYKVYLLSNTNPYIMDWACSPNFTSKGKGLNDYFDKLYLSYETGYTKPHEGIFNYMLNDANINPDEAMFIDDGLTNVEAAHRLGMHTFNPENGTLWCEELRKALFSLKKE